MIEVTIRVFYSCPACHLTHIGVDVPARVAEDAVTWLEEIVTPLLLSDHERRNPACRPQGFQDVMLPMNGDRLGGPILQ